MNGAHQWRGVIEEYRDRLPVSKKTPVVSLREGGTPPGVRVLSLSETLECEGVAEVRGCQPDRIVQGPRDDDGHQQGRRRWRPGGDLRVDRQHLGECYRRTPSRPAW